MDLLHSKETNEYFSSNGYHVIKPYPIVNERDTVFTTAGIQPIKRSFLEDKLDSEKKYFVPQSVIRTQFFDHIKEGTSLAFINGTTAKFNLSEEEYNRLVTDYVNYFYETGLAKSKIRAWFKKAKKEESITKGKELLEREIKKLVEKENYDIRVENTRLKEENEILKQKMDALLTYIKEHKEV